MFPSDLISDLTFSITIILVKYNPCVCDVCIHGGMHDGGKGNRDNRQMTRHIIHRQQNILNAQLSVIA